MNSNSKNSRIFLFIFLGIFIVFGDILAKPGQLDFGTNMHGISDWMTSMPFIDVMKQSRQWYTQNNEWIGGGQNAWNTGYIDQVPKDKNGYPLYSPVHIEGAEAPQVIKTIWAIVKAWPEGDYTMYYEGTGKFSFNGNLYVKNSEPGKIILGFNKPAENKDGMFELGIAESDSLDPVKNIRIYLPGFDSTDANLYFNPEFTSKLAPFSALRFMDWGQTNNWGHKDAWSCWDEPGDTLKAKWDERRLPDHYTFANNKGVPYEIMIKLCNDLNKDMWICVPHNASDDYIRNLALLLKENLKPELKIYVEYSNEVWNWMFGQTQWLNRFYCEEQGVSWPEGIVPVIQNCLDLFSEVFASEMHRIVRVVGVQGGWQDVANRTVFNMRAGSYDAFAPAAYFGLSDEGDKALDQLGAAAKVEDVVYWVRKNMRENSKQYLRSQNSAIANSLNIPMIYYEGGQHITPHPFGAEPTYSQALIDVQRDTAMYNLYNEWFDFLETLIPEDEKALFANFSLIGSRSARYGSWGILETVDQDTSLIYAPKYSAILDRINKNNQTHVAGKADLENQFELYPGYPNPFNGTATISYNIPEKGQVALSVYDVLGREVESLVNEIQEAGQYTIAFDAKELASGLYFTKLSFNQNVRTQRILYIK